MSAASPLLDGATGWSGPRVVFVVSLFASRLEGSCSIRFVLQISGRSSQSSHPICADFRRLSHEFSLSLRLRMVVQTCAFMVREASLRFRRLRVAACGWAIGSWVNFSRYKRRPLDSSHLWWSMLMGDGNVGPSVPGLPSCSKRGENELRAARRMAFSSANYHTVRRV